MDSRGKRTGSVSCTSPIFPVSFKVVASVFAPYKLQVHYIGSAAPAIKWAREAIEPVVGHAVEVLPVSPVIGVHVGPAVGIAYECERPVPGKLTAPTSELVFSL